MKRVTLADIAIKAEVSKATVSLALNGHPRISDETRRKIERTATELGYRPDSALASLASYRWEDRRGKSGINLVLLTDDRDFSRHLVPGVKAEANSLGYNLEPMDCSKYKSGGALSRILIQRGVQGIVMNVKNHDWLVDFDWSSFAVVNAGHNELPVQQHQIRADAAESVYGAWRKVRELGYQRIGISIFHDNILQKVGMQRLAAADCIVNRLRHGNEQGSVFEAPFAVTGESGFGSLIKPFDAWLKAFSPDVIIGTNAAVYWYLDELGYQVPDDVALALVRLGTPGKEDSPMEFAGMTCDEMLLGRRMVNELDLMIKRGEKGAPEHPHITVLPPYWMSGESCPRKTGS